MTETMSLPYPTCGERNGMAKLSDQLVAELRARRAQSCPMAELAAEAGATRSTASKAERRHTWRHIP